MEMANKGDPVEPHGLRMGLVCARCRSPCYLLAVSPERQIPGPKEPLSKPAPQLPLDQNERRLQAVGGPLTTAFTLPTSLHIDFSPAVSSVSAIALLWFWPLHPPQGNQGHFGCNCDRGFPSQ